MTDQHVPRPAGDSPAGTSEATTTVGLAGRPVRIRRSGPADAPPVVLLHGIGRSLEDSSGSTGAWNSEHDLLPVINGAGHVWIDHSEFTDAPGLDSEEPSPRPRLAHDTSWAPVLRTEVHAPQAVPAPLERTAGPVLSTGGDRCSLAPGSVRS